MSTTEQEEEIWETHPVFTRHKGSNLGRVFNTKTCTFLKGHKHKNGYTILHFRGYSQRNSVQVALQIFTYECFNGSIDSSQWDIDHKNSDKKKYDYNYLRNLDKLSRAEHVKKTHQGKKQKSTKNREKPVWRILIQQGIEIERKQFKSANSLEKTNRYRQGAISNCCYGRAKTHKGYHWEFVKEPDLQNEIWVSLIDSKYTRCMVSNLGRVKHKGLCSYGTLKQDGYRAKQIGGINYQVHTLICTAFKGERPSLKHTVDHIDRNIDNNKSDNLRWADKQQQSNNISTVRRVIAFKNNGDIYKQWNTISQAAKDTGYCISGIRKACRNNNYTIGKLKWQQVEE